MLLPCLSRLSAERPRRDRRDPLLPPWVSVASFSFFFSSAWAPCSRTCLMISRLKRTILERARSQ